MDPGLWTNFPAQQPLNENEQSSDEKSIYQKSKRSLHKNSTVAITDSDST
jgi:hypothetical protein